jgi:Lhr-like helicase
MKLHQDLQIWFNSKYKLTSLQKQISFSENTLVIAPTGLGKTFSSFILMINHIYSLYRSGKNLKKTLYNLCLSIKIFNI